MELIGQSRESSAESAMIRGEGAEDASAKVWIVRGPPAVGKSALGRRILRAFPGSAVIDVDKLRSMVPEPNWKDRASQQAGLRHAAALVKSFLSEGRRPVVVIDTLAPLMLEYFLPLLGLNPRIITLVCSPSALLDRMKQRDVGFKDEGTALRMNEQYVGSARKANEVLIDTSNISADEVARIVLDQDLAQPRFHVITERKRLAGKKEGRVKRDFQFDRLTPNGTLLLIRHAKPVSRDDYVVPPGPPLSPVGIKQAEDLATSLGKLQVAWCYHSPFARATQTAKIVFEGRCPMSESPAWSEKGLDERYREVLKRVGRWLQESTPADGRAVAVVGHGASLKAAVELIAPDSIPAGGKDKEGNIIPQSGLWVLKWSKGTLIQSCALAPGSLLTSVGAQT